MDSTVLPYTLDEGRVVTNSCMFIDKEQCIIAWILESGDRTFVAAEADLIDLGRVATFDLMQWDFAVPFDQLIADFWKQFGNTSLREVKPSALQYASFN